MSTLLASDLHLDGTLPDAIAQFAAIGAQDHVARLQNA